MSAGDDHVVRITGQTPTPAPAPAGGTPRRRAAPEDPES